MAEQTIHVFSKDAITITRDNGAPTNQGDVIGNALNGNAFSWENPSDLSFTFAPETVAITFDDADGILGDDPFSGSTVIDQRLSEPVTINGTTYTPSVSSVRWQYPAPVNVENEYEVTLYDDEGTAYRMVGVSITQGYSTQVVGVMFDGATPPPGTTLHYIQGVSSYGGAGETVEIPDGVPCFLAGTRIDAPRGAKPVEALRPGDLVQTLDHGPQLVRWAGISEVCGLRDHAPIRISAGALGQHRTLSVSPNHRILLRGAQAEIIFGEHEVFAPAKALVNGRTIRSVPMRRASYVHLLFDRHEVVFAEGLATESLFAGDVALSALSSAVRADLATVLLRDGIGAMRLARRGLTVGETRNLVAISAPPNFAGRTRHANPRCAA